MLTERGRSSLSRVSVVLQGGWPHNKSPDSGVAKILRSVDANKHDCNKGTVLA